MMTRRGTGAIASVAVLMLAITCAAQPNRPGRPQPGGPAAAPAADEGKLPDDPRLLQIHREFVIKALELAGEYEKKREYDKARTACLEVLKLVPGNTGAEKILGRIGEIEATAEKKTVDVLATKAWQDTGITVLEGKPIKLAVSGTWVFAIEHITDASGVSIPKEMQEFPLGSLIGKIVPEGGDEAEAKSFLVGPDKEIFARMTGRLYLKMHDNDPRDNKGKLTVVATGTFKIGR